MVLIRLALLLLLAAAPALRAAQPATVGVLYFDNNSLIDKASYDGLRKGLCDMLITELSKMSGLHVVERAQLEKIMSEIALGQSGAVDESTVPKVGKLLGADILVLGGFMKDMGSKIRIDIRMVNVESGEILKAEEVTGSPEKLFKLIKQLSFKIADNLDVSLSRTEKKRIAQADNVDLETLLVYSDGLELLDRGNTKQALGKFRKALSMDKTFSRAQSMITRLEESQ